MNKQRSRWLATALVGIGVLTVPLVGNAAAPQSAGGGGEIIDGGTFVGGPPEHIDPALNTTLDAYQVINALYDGLTEIDISDPENSQIVPLLAESFEPNEDATVWTFTIKEGQQFADGEAILPSTFQRSWERVADLAGDYSYLLNFIEGGAERLAGEADTISGVVADDEAMTLTVTLSAPYSNFPAVAGFQTFFPMPEAAVEAGDTYENELMVGNGPYMMESARSDEEIVLVRNDNWAGDFNGETWPDRAERIVFRDHRRPRHVVQRPRGRRDRHRQHPAGAVRGGPLELGHHDRHRRSLGSYHFIFNQSDPRVGGDENLLLRQAISMAIDRDAINESVYNGLRTISTGVTPPGIPGFAENLCDYCAYDPEAAQAAYDEWLAAGNEPETIPIQFNADAGHEPVVAIFIDNLAAIGIEAEADPRITRDVLLRARRRGVRDLPGRVDRRLPDVRQLHVRPVPHRVDRLQQLRRRQQPGVRRPRRRGQADDRPGCAGGSCSRRPRTSSSTRRSTSIPINWYLGDYAFNPEAVANFSHSRRLGLIPWEQLTVTK